MIADIRKQKTDLLTSAGLACTGLSVDDGGALSLANVGITCLVVSLTSGDCNRAVKPECGFVLIDKLEQMDQLTLQEFGAWLEQEDCKAIATREYQPGDE